MSSLQLVLIRHATAESPFARTDDAQRQLTDEGAQQAYRLGTWLRDNNLLPDAVVCSSATRTRQTWAQIVEATKSGVAIEIEPSIYEADVETLLQVLREADAPLRRLALVGHAPGVPTLAYDLDDGQGTLRDDLARGFAPASVAVVELDVPLDEIAAGTGRLVALLDGSTLL